MSTPCDFCGLPAPAPAADEDGHYCCFGCRFAAEVSAARGSEGEARWTLARLGLAIFLTLNVMVFTMALWAGDVYGDAATHSQFSATLASLFRYLGFIFSLPVLWALGVPLAENAWQRTRQGLLSADLLIVAGVLAAFAYSAVSVFRGAGAVYFEVACIVLVMITLGRWLEATGRAQAHSLLELLDRLLPETAVRVTGEAESQVSLDALAVGDQIHVRAGERLPADGRIVRGQAHLDEQALTGESDPIVAGVGDAVRAAAANLDGDLIIELTARPREGTWQRLVAAVDRARQVKGSYERLTDRLAAAFLPLVVALAAAAFVGHTLTSGWEQGVLAALAVLLISCPCALGLATPLALWVAHGEALRRGVVFATSEALERLAEVRAVACDKTGTLTTGAPQLVETVLEHESERDCAQATARRLAGASQHLLSRALLAGLPADVLSPCASHSTTGVIRTIPGRGLAEVDEQGAARAWLGSPRYMNELGLKRGPVIERAIVTAAKDGAPVTCLARGDRVRAVFRFAETLRPETQSFLEACQSAGLRVAVLTGDQAARGSRLGQVLGVQVLAGLLPDDKVAALARLRGELGPVAMVGDGINDAPALAASDVGVALGCGADIARSSADVCLMGNDLRAIPWAIELAQRTRQTIRQNLFWALIYNVAGLGLAVAGWLNPVWAALAMVLSSAFVVSNSLRWKHALAGDAQPATLAPREEPPSPASPTPPTHNPPAPAANGVAA